MSISVAERARGIYGALQSPMLYKAFQHLVGSDSSRRNFVDNYIRPQPGDRVLDVGCGTGELAGFLPGVEFVGFDPNPEYIETASTNQPQAEFHVLGIDEALEGEYGSFDIVVAKGVLHHLTDDQVRNVGVLAARSLKENGRFVSVDPCYVANQQRIARELVSRDRGSNVRDLHDYQKLIEANFATVNTSHHSDFLRIPYDHAVIEATV